jgi:hypothetical protein
VAFEEVLVLEEAVLEMRRCAQALSFSASHSSQSEATRMLGHRFQILWQTCPLLLGGAQPLRSCDLVGIPSPEWGL